MVLALKKGPFNLDLDKSVHYIIMIFKGLSVGVIFSTLIAIIIMEVDLVSDDTTDDEASSLRRKILLTLCVCAFSMAYFYLCIYLYKGVEERNRTWVFPWFLVTGGVDVALLIVFFYSLNYSFGIIHIVLPLIIMFVFYCVLIVYSFYVDLGVNFVPDPPTQVVPL